MRGESEDARVVRPAALVFVMVLLVGALLIALNVYSTGQLREREAHVPSILIRPVTGDDHIRGSRDAPVQMIVFTDFECPYCKSLHQRTLPLLQKDYGSSLVIVYRHFPLPRFSKSQTEAEASECAYLLGGDEAFWDYADNIFTTTPSENGLDLDELPKIAQRVGLDVGQFEKCLAGGKGAARVEADKREGVVAGISITPSIVFRHRNTTVLVEGSYLSRIRAAIDYLLEKDTQEKSL